MTRIEEKPQWYVSPLVPTTAIILTFILTLILYIAFSSYKKHDAIITLDELITHSSQITEEKKMVEKNGSNEDKCATNKKIAKFNKERWELLSSPSFLEQELLPPEIKKFNISCEEEAP